MKRSLLTLTLSFTAVLLSATAYAQAIQDPQPMLDALERIGHAVEQRRLCGISDNQTPQMQRVYDADMWFAQSLAASPDIPELRQVKAKVTPTTIDAAFSRGAASALKEGAPSASLCVQIRQALQIKEAQASAIADTVTAQTRTIRSILTQMR